MHLLKHWRPESLHSLVPDQRKQALESPDLLATPDSWKKLSREEQMQYIRVRKDLGAMFMNRHNYSWRDTGGFHAFEILHWWDEEMSNLAYDLTAEIAKGEQDNWIYASNCLLCIKGSVDNRIGTDYYLVDMISKSPALRRTGLIYYPSTHAKGEHIIEDDASGEIWQIQNSAVVKIN